MTDKIKNYALIIISFLLLLSIGGNVWQGKIRKNDRIAQELSLANSNTIIAGKEAEISIRDSIIAKIRQERRKDSLQFSTSLVASKQRVAVLQAKIEKLPKVIVYNPDSATVDSLRIAFSLKDSTINTQALTIVTLEVEKEGYFKSFHREIGELEGQKSAQVVAINQLQDKVVEEQGKVRKEVRKKKFWRFLAGVGIATAGVLAVMSR